ncbi:MAG: hypothetical protein HY747_04245 [Elusimicrobia bacterium]|nr:hypothetical protein [Elusimicrobiota bacterium]
MTGFKVKNYHIKSHKSVWDSKTAVLHAEGGVDISLNLQDETTAHILSDSAQENKAEATGSASGNVRALWQDVTILSQEARWNLADQWVKFFGGEGHLTHKNFMAGRLEMEFDVLEDRIDFQDRSFITAAKAKGVWTPYEEKANTR